MAAEEFAIVYCSTKGHTAEAAERIAAALGEEHCALYRTKDVDAETLAPHALLIFGAPTFGMGDLDRRMQRRLKVINPACWEGKPVAFFIMGDQVYHGKTFAGGLQGFATFFSDQPVRRVGRWKDEGYTYEASNSVEPDGFFPGLVLDEITQAEMSGARIAAWVAALKAEVPL